MAPDQNGSAERDVGTPRWVKIFGAIALVVGLVFIIMFVVRGPHRPGQHGRSRHMGAEIVVGPYG